MTGEATAPDAGTDGPPAAVEPSDAGWALDTVCGKPPMVSKSKGKISGDFVIERDGEVLRSIPSLEFINDKPAAEFFNAAGAGSAA